MTYAPGDVPFHPYEPEPERRRVQPLYIIMAASGLLFVGVLIAVLLWMNAGSAPRDAASDMYETYAALADDEALWEYVPQTEEGVHYYQAFLFKLMDFKVGESFERLSSEEYDELRDLEKRFLALEDLDITVEFTRSDGTVFRHDGTAPRR